MELVGRGRSVEVGVKVFMQFSFVVEPFLREWFWNKCYCNLPEADKICTLRALNMRHKDHGLVSSVLELRYFPVWVMAIPELWKSDTGFSVFPLVLP